MSWRVESQRAAARRHVTWRAQTPARSKEKAVSDGRMECSGGDIASGLYLLSISSQLVPRLSLHWSCAVFSSRTCVLLLDVNRLRQQSSAIVSIPRHEHQEKRLQCQAHRYCGCRPVWSGRCKVPYSARGFRECRRLRATIRGRRRLELQPRSISDVACSSRRRLLSTRPSNTASWNPGFPIAHV